MQTYSDSGHTSLNIGFLMQRGFDFNVNSGPKAHFLSILKAFHAMRHQASVLSLQEGRKIAELRYNQPEPQEKAAGFSGSPLFRGIEMSIRFPQSKFKLPYLGFFDSFRFREACIKHLAHCNIFYERYNPMCLGGVWAAKHLAIPLILEVHADIINTEIPLHSKPLQGFQHYLAELTTRTCFNRATKIVVVSDQVGERLRTYWQVPADKILTVPLGADVEAFQPMAGQAAVRARFGLADEPVVMFVGSFHPWHGVDVLVQAFAHVHSAVPQAKLVLVGDGQVRPAIETQVRQAGLADHVLFTGSIAHPEVPPIVNIADVTVAPYPPMAAELWFSPLKVFEYMAAGKAVVASRAGQITQVVQEGSSGLLIEPGDADALAQAIIRLLNDSELRARLGAHARNEAVAKYSWRAHAEKLEQLFLSVLAADAPGRQQPSVATI